MKNIQTNSPLEDSTVVKPNKQKTTKDSVVRLNDKTLKDSAKINRIDKKQTTSGVIDTLDNEPLRKEHNLYEVYVVPFPKDSTNKIDADIDSLYLGLEMIKPTIVPDSLLNKPLQMVKSIFSNHLLQTKSIKPQAINPNTQNWIAPLLLLLVLMVAILRVFYQKKFTLFFQAAFSKRYSNQLTREENVLTQGVSVILLMVYLFSFSLFLYFVLNYYHITFYSEDSFINYLAIVLFSVLFYSIKVILIKISGFIFNTLKDTSEYIFYQFLMFQFWGLLLSIICIVYLYGSYEINKTYLLYTGFAILIFSFILRIIKSKEIASVKVYSPFYIFLYLCTLEILPVLILIKLLV